MALISLKQWDMNKNKVIAKRFLCLKFIAYIQGERYE